MLESLGGGVPPGEHLSLSAGKRCFHLLEEKRVVSRFGSQNEPNVVTAQVTDQRRVGRQPIPGSDDRQARMIPAKSREKPLARVAFAVILGVAILLEDRLGHQ